MPSYNEKLKCEIARRDQAIRAIRCNMSCAGDAVGGAVQNAKESLHQVKESLRPSHLVEELRTEYNPVKLVDRYPFASVLTALAAGFVVVPLIRSAVATVPPKPPPQRVIIEVAGAGAVAHKIVSDEAPGFSWKDMALEVLALFGGVKGLMERFGPFASGASGAAAENGHAENGHTDSATVASETKTSPAISRRYAPPPEN